MNPDAGLIIACPHCHAPAKVLTPIAPNPIGAITWTDGFQETPMAPRPPRITRCHACGKHYWLDEAPQLGLAEEPPPDATDDETWKNAPPVESLDEAGAFEALAQGLGYNRDLEMELRVLAWWRGNDAFRCADAPLGYATSPAAVANMERLLELMEDGDEDLLLFRAEAQRQLGRFEEMEQTLSGVCCSDYWPAKSRLIELVTARSRKLEKLFEISDQ
ncbi:MAG: hypothetical protein M3463_18035 [Verrucomicrobiota bacterium]|nr:hypothetical protein [Verrucomicrobiota bacterium]